MYKEWAIKSSPSTATFNEQLCLIIDLKGTTSHSGINGGMPIGFLDREALKMEQCDMMSQNLNFEIREKITATSIAR
jgi:hypothetical protein